MKIFKNNQKILYVFSCILIAFFLYGCKEKGGDISVLDSLPESAFLTEMKTSLENHVPLAIAFTAEWCPHCRKYKPVFNEVKDLYRDKVTFINIDVDDASGSPISSRFQVRGIPTTAFVRADGSVYIVQVGEIEKDNLVKIADELIVHKKRKKGEPVASFPLDTKKEEVSPEEKKEPVKEEAKPAEEMIPPAQEEPPPSLPAEPSDETVQPPEPNEGEQNDSLDSEDPSSDGTLPEEETVPEQL